MKAASLRTFVVTLCLCLAGTATAAFDEEAAGARIRKLHESGNKAGAVKEMRNVADQGIAWGQTALAISYMRGEGIEKSIPEAIKWFEKAAEQDFAAAQYHLGGLYAQGHGGNEKKKRAVELMRRSADQGYEKAIVVMKTWGLLTGSK
jgi:TPR repeat protein